MTKTVKKKVAVKKTAAKIKKTKISRTRIAKPTVVRKNKKLSWVSRLSKAWQTTAQTQPEILWFGAVMLAAMIFRWMQPDWYMNRQFHPDERWIFGVVSQLSYPKEPTALQYGTFPLYLLATIKDLVAIVASWFGGIDVNQFVIWAGRMLSGLFDLGTVVFAYLIGGRLLPGEKGRRVGLLASALLAFTVLHIQMAHFFVVDVPLATLTMAVIYYSIRMAQEQTRQDYILAGICLGLAAATKTSAAPLGLAMLLGHGLALAQTKPAQRMALWQNFGISLASSGMVFFLAMPYAFLDWDRFWTNQNEQQRILVTGLADVPYNRQYLHTAPYLYYAKNLIKYTMGPVLGLLSVLVFMAYPITGVVQSIRSWRQEGRKKVVQHIVANSGFWIMLVYALAYFAIIGNSFAKFNRYMLPLTPIFCLLSGHALYWLYTRMKNQLWQRSVQVLIGVVVGAALLWSLAFVSIYQKEHPWIAASRWIQKELPEKIFENGLFRPTAILNEEWGDDLPTYVKEYQPKAFQMNKFAVQEPDTERKREQIINLLQRNDVIAMADTRAHAVYRRLPERYPINAAYFELMFEEKLGFKLAADFKNYPSLFGREFPDDQADESFTLYDHPHTFLFRRELPGMSQEQIIQRLDERTREIQVRVAQKQPLPALPVAMKSPPTPLAVGPLPTVVNPNIGASQGKPFFILGKLNGFTASLAWLLLIELIGLLSIPLCLSLFPRLPDSGVALSKIIGTLLLTWVVWMLVSCGIMQHLQGTSFLVLLALGGASLVWAIRRGSELEEFIQRRGKYWLMAEIIFIVAFVGYILTKCYNPDIKNPYGQGYNGGGEPMGLSFLTAAYQSIHFPPYDPWLSGYPINYYYYGQMMLGILAKLLGVPPEWAYQICISLLFAFTFTGVYGLGLGLTGKRRWGVMAAISAAMLGNLHTWFYMLEPFTRGIHWNEVLASLGQIGKETLWHISRFEFIWNPTRLIKGTINEMPWFSFLYGDLHAHIIAMPFSLPLIAWAINLLTPGNEKTQLLPEAPGRNGTERGLAFFMTALCLGALACINTWNFPPYALLILGVLLVKAFTENKKQASPWPSVWIAVLAWLRLVVGSLILFFFFHKNFKPQSTSLAFVNPEVRTHLKEFLEFFGLMMFAMMSFWAMQLVPWLKNWFKKIGGNSKRRKPWWQTSLQWGANLWNQHPVVVYVVVSVVLGLVLLGLFNQLLIGLLTLLLVAAAFFLAAWPLTPPLRVATLLAFLGLGICWGCELVHVRDFMGVGGDMSRMNTVFKFYMVAWIFFALAGVTFLSQLFPGTREENRTWRRLFGGERVWQIPVMGLGILLVWGMANYFQEILEMPLLAWTLALTILGAPWLWAFWPKQDEVRRLWVAVLAAIVMVVATYPIVSVFNRMRLCSEFKHPTINGMAYLDRLLPKEAKALRWINQHLTTNAIVLEAPGVRGYNCFDTRVAIFTGQPTLIGWIGQEEQMRYQPELTGSHTRDADQIFQTPDIGQAKRLLDHYRIEYVFVGENERKAYSELGLSKFSSFMDKVYDQEGVQIYKQR